MNKHKEIKRWAAGVASWTDNATVACATLVETPKMFRLLGSKKTDKAAYGAAERHFYSNAGYRSQWNKDSYSEVGSGTEEAALAALVKDLEVQLERAEVMVRARKRVLESVQEQIANKTWDTVK